MAQQTKPTPTKYCEWCGIPFERNRVGKNAQLECVSNFMRRKFCSISCSVKRQHATEPPTKAASRKRVKRLNKGFCEACGLEAETVVHHVDNNPMNNSPDNLQTLCTYCHSFWHAMHKRIGKVPSTRMSPLTEWASCGEAVTASSRKRRQSS